MFMFYFQYVQKRGEIMRSRISKTWPCHLKRAVLLSLLSGLFILPSQINAETSGEEYKDHQIAEADWDGAKAEQDFWSGKGIRNGSDYTFNKNTIISTELSKGSLVFHKTDPGIMDQLYAFGALVWGSSKTGTVNMNGHDLSLRAGKGDLHRIGGSFQWGGRGSAGLFVRSGNLTMKNLGSLSVSGVDYGIYLFAERSDDEAANSNLWIRNGGSADHAVKIRSEGKGIYLQSTPGAARLTVDGDVDIEAPSGIVVDRGEAAVGGGKIDSKGEAAVSVNAKSKFYMNAGVDTEGNVTVAHSERNVQVLGDIRSKQNSSVFIGLGNSQSVLKGLFTTDLHTWPYNEWVLTGSKGFLALKNGATWEHEKYGTGRDKNGRIDVGDSHLTRLNADGGVIIQKDKRKIQIDDFRGNAKLIYDHQNDGTKIEDYTAGDFIIDKAGQNSFLTVVTSNSGLDMGNKEKVSQALNALAGKVYYSSYVTDERNLKGKAVVAEGLTASSAELGFGNITFTQDKGQGTVKSEDVKVTAQPAAELSPITGDAGKDKYYAEKKIRQADGTYLFKENTDLQMTDGQPMVSSEKPVVIKAEGKRLAFTSAGDQNGTVSTVQQSSKDSLSITAKELAVKAGNKSDRSEGIHLQNGNKQNAYKTDITGDVTIQSKGKGYALGAYVAGNSSLDIHGDMTIKGEGGTWGVENTANPGGAYAHYSTAGLYAGSNYAIQKGGHITVDGDVDLKVKGTGILANGGGSTVVVKGGGTVSIENNDDAAHYALAAESGKIDFNVDEDEIEAGTKKVTIEGNVGVLNGAVNPSEPQKYSQIYLGLGTGDSLWRGLAVDTHTKQNNADGFEGQLSLFMKNGATWINEAYGMTPEGFKGSKVYYLQGGKSKEEAGVIFQKDENTIRIETYAGNMKLIYAHENAGTKAEDYKAGDTHIANATENSWITMVTDRNNINTDNEAQVYEVLNTLAGKLYYEAYTRDEKDLRGEAAIAEGLTASSQTIKMKDLLFKKENGQGYVKSPDTGTINELNHQIVEGVLKGGRFVEYWKSKGVTSGDRNYLFNKDVVLTVEGTDSSTEVHMNKGFAPIMWTGDGQGVIDMNHHALKLIALKGTQVKFPHGILMHSGTLTIKNTKGIDISAEDGLEQRGIVVHGQTSMGAGYFGSGKAKLVIENKNTAEDTLKIRTTGKFEHYPLIEAKAEVNGTAKIDIKGRVDLENKGNDTSRVIRTTEGQISIGSGRIVTDASDSIMAESWSDDKKREAAEVLVNSTLESSGAEGNMAKPLDENNIVEIKGNIISTQHARTGVSLTNKESKLTGLVSGTTWRGIGENYVTLKNGAVWENRNNSSSAGGGASANTLGSHVEFLQGGDAVSGAGTIYQQDAHDIHVKNYRGHTTVIYEHDATVPTNPNEGFAMKGGDFKIAKAAANSGITLRTDNTGLNTSSTKAEDKNLVSGTLNKLANKLYYEAYAKGENNLTGKVEIAEGLTAQSASMRVEDITYKKETGQGQYLYTPAVDPKLPKTITKHGQGKTIGYYVGDDKKETWNEDVVVDVSGSGVANGKENNNVTGIYLLDGGQVTVNGNLKLTLRNAVPATRGASLGADVAHYYMSGIYAGYGGKTGDGSHGDSKFTVNGNVDMDVTGVALQANKDGFITVRGGKIKTHEIKTSETYAMLAEEGSVFMNTGTNGNEPGTEDVEVYGNLGVINKNYGWDPNPGNHASLVSIALTTSKSKLTGGVLNEFAENGNNPHQSGIDIYLKNGGLWENRWIGTERAAAVQKRENKDSYLYTGSKVRKLIGGASEAERGIIHQKENKPITVENYNGYEMVYYDHSSDGNIIGGDFVVKHAGEGSHITLRTDNKGLNTSSTKAADKNLVSATLNKLASKLYYSAYKDGERNLTGKVEIAEGLTAPSASREGKITYKDADGQGQYIYTPAVDPTPPPEGQTGTVFNKGVINGQFAFASSSDFVKYKVWHSDTKTYDFTKDSILNVKSITGEKDKITVNAPGMTLTLNSKDQYGIQSYCGRGYKADNNYKKVHDVNITAKKLILNVDQLKSKASGKDTFGIISGSSPGKTVTVNGDVDIHVTNKYYKEPDATGEAEPTFTNGIATVHHGRVVINGNVNMEVKVPGQEALKDASFLNHYFVNGIFSGLNYDKDQPGSSITISGDANISTDGTGIHAGARSTITIGGGGTIRTEKHKNISHFALNAEEGIINMNAKLNQTGEMIGAGNRTTKVYGNIGIIDREESANISGSRPTVINLGLTTSDSVLHGVVLDDFKEHNKNEPDKKDIRERTGLSMYLQNGASWHNEVWGTMVPSEQWRGVSHSFTGSKLRSIVGGKSADQAGVIFQENEKPITVENYSGYVKVLYQHDKLHPSKIKGGDFIVRKAAAGSGITLRTDNTGLNTSSGKAADKNLVSETLNALAGKLYYEAYKNGEKNLAGTVEIAEGLTAQSATKRLETMTYKAGTGQGQYLYTPATEDNPNPNPNPNPKPNPNPNPNPKPKPPIIYGSKETQMMKGAKTAMTSAVLLWRGNNNDLQRRMGDIRLAKEENGIWARYLGGKNKMDKQNTYLKQTYDIAQVGYDKKKGNWTIGAALDYGTGKDTYANGTGKGKLASLALYGTMQKEDGQYIDVILKGSHIKNDYTVYNEMNHRLEGKYRTNGLSLSMEYGKRMKKENGFYIDPSIELTAGHLGGKDYDAVSDYAGGKKMHIHQDGINSVIGRIGLGIGKETERSNLFAKIALAHEFGGKVKSIFSAENEPTSGTEVDLKDSWVDVEVGGSWLVNRNTYLYGTYTRNFGADVSSKWRIDAGIRFSF